MDLNRLGAGRKLIDQVIATGVSPTVKTQPLRRPDIRKNIP